MTYSQEREEFIASMAKEGLPVSVTRQVLAMANSLQRYAELSCSSEAADRDRVKCPAVRSDKVEDCLCDQFMCSCGHSCMKHAAKDYGACSECACERLSAQHESVPRIDVSAMRTQRRIVALLKDRPGFAANFQGDPRGAVVKIAVPSGRYDDMGKVGMCVPSKGLPASFWDRNR